MSISDEVRVAENRSDGAGSASALATVEPEAKPVGYRKVAILGSADSSIYLAPVGDSSWELWGLPWSHDPNTFKGIVRWIDPHPLEWMKGRHEGYIDHLKSLAPSPVYMIQQYEEIPNSVRYPIEAILKEFQGYRNRPNGSYASSIAYEMALAILEGVQEIGLWGVDLLTEGEYAIQRPNVEYLIGIAEGRGIKVTIPEQSALLKGNHSYGYETMANDTTGINSQYLKERRLKYENEKTESLAKAQTYDGGVQACGEMLTFLTEKQGQEAETVLNETVAWIQQHSQDYSKKKENAMARAQTFDGAWQEADALYTQIVHWEKGGIVAANSPQARDAA